MPRPGSRNFLQSEHRSTIVGLTALIVIISIIFFSYLSFGTASEESEKSLILVNVLFRHGDRTPTDSYLTDPYKDETYWPEGRGALTTKGKQEAFDLGVFLRHRYATFLPELYSPEDMYVVSSDHDRCLMSAYLCLAGLYPPTGWQLWNSQLLWQPIPVHTTPRNLDQLIVVKKPCPKYDEEFSKIKKAVVLTPEEERVLQHLSKYTGAPVTDILTAELIYNTLEIQEKRGLLLPSWTSSVYPQPLFNMSARSLALFTLTPSLQRFKGGPLLKDIVIHMFDKISQKLHPDRKLFLYSGHDLTIVSFLSALGYEAQLKPDPAAAVILELHKGEGGSYYVKILYKDNRESKDLRSISIPGCDEPCSFKNFLDVTKKSVPQDWDEECKVT